MGKAIFDYEKLWTIRTALKEASSNAFCWCAMYVWINSAQF